MPVPPIGGNPGEDGQDGQDGIDGKDGGNFHFPSLADRDTFFTTNPDLLVTDLPVSVNFGDPTGGIVVNYVWLGESVVAQGMYDPDLWRPASLGTTPGTLYLGQGGVSVNSANSAVGFMGASQQRSILYGSRYDDTGSEDPFYYDLSARISVPISDVYDTVLTPPFSMQFSSVGNTLTRASHIRPASTGLFRIQTHLGTDDTGPIISDRTLLIEAGDIGTEVMFERANPLLSETGNQQHVVMSGVDLYGGLQTSGIFNGEITPYFATELHQATVVGIATVDDNALGYVLATWGANLQTLGRHPAINSPSNSAEITSLGIMASMPVPAAGTIDTVTYYNNTGDNTTEFQIIKNGAVMHTFTCTGPYGVETGINVPTGFVGGVPDNIAIRYSAGTAPSDGIYTMYVK